MDLAPTILARGLLLGFLAQAPSGLAHLPELYGREYIRLVGQPDSAVPGPAVSQLSAPSKRDRFQHENQIADAERSGGPYAAGLTDPLINLGYYHHRRGDLDSAIEAYRRALYLVRVNDGLTSPRQIPILREMLGIYRSTGDHVALGDAYQYYYRLRKLGEPPHTQGRLDASLEYLTWERQLYASRSDGSERAHLLRAYRANENMLASLVPKTDQELDWYIRLAMSQMRNLYLMLGDDPLPMDVAGVSSGQGAAADAVNRQIAFIQKTGFYKGKRLLEAAIEQAHLSPPVDLATLHLELGDWQQWNGKLRQASKQYTRVVELLRAAGEDELVMLWLDQPVELPDEPDLWAGIHGKNSSGRVVVEARYDVTARGDVKKIEVSVIEDEELWQAWRIKRMLRDTHFRPRFSQGQPEAVEYVTGRYMLIEAD